MSIVDKVEDKVKGSKKANVTKVTAHYGADMTTEVWFEGPHGAAGWVLDMLLGLTESDLEITSITVVPNAEDVPRTPQEV